MTRSALLVMDVQNSIVSRFPGDGYLERVGGAVAAARKAGVPVIFVGVGFRPGTPEIAASNPTFSRLRGASYAVGDDATAFHADVAPEGDDIVVHKKRVSAFAGSDLEMVLRAQEIGHLVLTGIATSGVVLSTLRQAADLDFTLTVLADGCLDSDEEVHRVLTEKVFPKQATVTTVSDWTASL